MSRPAVFLDRDGTIIWDYHFIGKPELVKLLPGAADAVRRVNDAGILVIVATNQSGIARGYFTEGEYEAVQARLYELLAEAAGARIDDSYMCPHHPDFTGPCECRKPGTLLYRRAATDHDLDLARSWYIGDKARDVIPAIALHGRGVLIPNDETPQSEIDQARKELSVAASLDEAVGQVIESAR